MLILGTVNEVQNQNSLSDVIEADIMSMVKILDDCYGCDRNVFTDLGGFIAVVDDTEGCNQLCREWQVDVFNDICDEVSLIYGYVKKLYIISADYAICAYINQNLMKGR